MSGLAGSRQKPSTNELVKDGTRTTAHHPLTSLRDSSNIIVNKACDMNGVGGYVWKHGWQCVLGWKKWVAVVYGVAAVLGVAKRVREGAGFGTRAGC